MEDKQKPYAFYSQQAAYIEAYLSAHYQILFNPEDPKPLAVGIHEQLRNELPDSISKTSIQRWLKKWVARTEYQKNLAKGGYRFDLSGNKKRIKPEHAARAAA